MTKQAEAAPPDTERGLYEKFNIERRDGTSRFGHKHYACEYFVLDLTHDPFAIAALRAYSKACATKYPKLAEELWERTKQLDKKD